MTREPVRSNLLLKVLILFQFIIIALTYVQARTPLIWIWAISSFIPVTIISLISNEKKYVISSLVLFFISQQSIFLFANSPWGYSIGGDSLYDLEVASVISERGNFIFGQTGYTRAGYSYYPLLHLFSAGLSKVSGLPLAPIALYVVPIFNASFVAVLLFYVNQELFGFHGIERNLATLFFAAGWYYSLYSANFTREVFAFPFALLTILIFLREMKCPKREYAVLLPILFAVVIMSHQVTSYVLSVVLLIIMIGYRRFYQGRRMVHFLVLYFAMLLSFTSFVAFGFFVGQVTHAVNAMQVLFEQETPTIMVSHMAWQRDLAVSYYLIIGAISLIGGLRLMQEKRKNREGIPLVLFFGLVFILSVLLRFSVSAGPTEGWTYYMSLRATIWAFIGISFLLIVGFRYVLKFDKHVNWKAGSVLILIICLLAAGKFSQNPLLISDPSITPHVTYQRYEASLWLRAEAVHGSNLLVAPYSSDAESYGVASSMAPYAYLSEYFLDALPSWNFSGYIPLIGGYYDRYENSPNASIVYCNGETGIAFIAR